MPLFYEGAGSGKVRAITHINNVSADVSVAGNGVLGDSSPLYLDDMYEGELMVLFMDLSASGQVLLVAGSLGCDETSLVL